MKKNETASFKKANSKQLTLNMLLYGPTKSGKSLTSLMMGEGLAKHVGKRMAVVNTESESGGMDFYTKPIATRRCHPEAIDFDVLETRSIKAIIDGVAALDPNEYGVLVIDSFTHVWRAAIEAYEGRMIGKAGDKIPMNAWASIKSPYNDLIAWLISSPFHVICSARQRDIYEVSDSDVEMVGVGPQCEKNTGYEFPVLIRLSAELDQKKHHKVHTAFVEGDRTGVLDGRRFPNPNFDMIAPLLPLLDKEQREREDEEERLARDAELLEAKAKAKLEKSTKVRAEYMAKILTAEDHSTLDNLAAEVRKKVRTLSADHREELLSAFTNRSVELASTKI